MSDLFIRPEAVMDAKGALEDLYPNDDVTYTGMEAAIAAFCKAEELTVEERAYATPERKGLPYEFENQQRLVGRWREVEE